MPGLQDGPVNQHTYTRIAHAQHMHACRHTWTHVHVNPSFCRAYILVKEDKKFKINKCGVCPLWIIVGSPYIFSTSAVCAFSLFQFFEGLLVYLLKFYRISSNSLRGLVVQYCEVSERRFNLQSLKKLSTH